MIGIDKILRTLNEYYRNKPYLGLEGCHASPSLDRSEFYAYWGILRSLSKEELSFAQEIIESNNYAEILSYIVKRVQEDMVKVYKKNMPVSVILARFYLKNASNETQERCQERNQQAIINSLSHSLCEMAQASIPIGGDTETSWAASEVQKLHQEVTTKKRPFLQQMSAIYEITGYFSYGMNYAISNFGLYSCPTEANHALHSMQVCDSLAANVRKSGCKDMMAIADLACHSYYYTQLYLFILNKINGNEEYKDRDFRYPLQNLGLLRHVYEKQLFGEKTF